MARPTTLPEPWRTLAEKLGSVQALSDALHSDPSAVRRWATGGRTPGGPAQALIEALFRQHGLEPPTW